jgi:hypothetical protein
VYLSFVPEENTSLKRVFSGLLVGLLLVSTGAHAQMVKASRGVIDLSYWDFEQQGNLRLDGEWEFYMSELISPDSINNRNLTKDFIAFPSTWNDVSMSKRPGWGYATYHLRIFSNKSEQLSLDLPHFYSNYLLWINSKLIAYNGQVSAIEKNSIPQWVPQTVTFEANSDTLDLVIQVSNFHHAKGGVRESIWIGKPDKLGLKRALAINSNLILIAGLLLTGFAFILIYAFSRKEISAVYFAALCITWAIRSAFSNLYPIVVFFPDISWELCVKVEYITLYAMMIWAVFFLADIFKQDVNNFFKYVLFAFNVIFVLITLFFSASVYTQFLPVYLSFCLILLLYTIYVLIRAVVFEREGVWLIVGCLMLGVSIFAYDLIAYQGLASFNPVIISLGYFVMFAMLAACLAYKFGFLKRTVRSRDILSYEDLYGK